MKKPVILCVDDEKIILDSLEEQVLKTLGDEFELELAESGTEALEVVEELDQTERPLAVIISDQIMPGIKGHQLLSKLQETHPNTRKILLTGQASLDAVQAAINQAKLYRYVTKPWEANDLMMTVQEAARSFMQQAQLERFNQSNKLLRNLNQASQALSGESDPHRLFQRFTEKAVDSVYADRGFLLRPNGNGFKLEAFAARSQADLQHLEASSQNEAQRTALLQELETKQRNTPHSKLGAATLALPLQDDEGQFLGLLWLENDETDNRFEEIQLEILTMLQSQLQISFVKAQLYNNLAAKTAELQQEKDKVEQVNALLEEKNKDIIDSINYAKRLQEVILPDRTALDKYFPESLVFYRPKDIVSGDFYWWYPRDDGTFLAAAVDCTGHGVPGAFMSVLASNLLNETARNLELRDMRDILQYLDLRMRFMLKQDADVDPRHQTLDGMDLAMVLYDPEKRQVQFGGAYNPLYLVRNGKLEEYEANKTSIAGHIHFDNEPTRKKIEFGRHLIQLQTGDMLYMTSDGFQDQFGGPKTRKFSRPRLKEMLTEVAPLSGSEQRKAIDKIFHEWKGTQEQMDDILILGLRVS